MRNWGTVNERRKLTLDLDEKPGDPHTNPGLQYDR